ncbi:MAG: chromate transporter [Clostridia bacterium]|nr:chromate transporter [Clostridia bacterium]
MKQLADLFLTFARVGALTFGGGYAMLPMLQREVVEKNGWASEEELMDWFAIGQCTPGVIAVNTATFTGRKLRGIPGAVAATLGMLAPSLVIICVIAALLQHVMEHPMVRHAFAGIRVCVCVMIVNAVIKLLKKAVVDVPTGCIYIAVVIAATVTPLSPVVFVLIAAVVGIVLCALGGKK